MKLLDLHLGKPLHRSALTLFPVWNGATVAARGYDLRSSDVNVSERAGSPAVGELVVTNAGKRPALLLEGELLEGGQQHRVCSRSVLITAGKNSLVLDVSCVEQGRWSGVTGHAPGGRRAPTSVRAARGQSAVWTAVERYEQRYERSDTHSLLAAVGRAEEAAGALVEGLRPLPFQCGVLVGIAGQPLLLEVFDSPLTLTHTWQPLLRSLAIDAVGAAPVATPGRRARRFVERLASFSLTEQPAGAATGVRGGSPYTHLSGLLWRDRAVHAVAVNRRHDLVAA